MNIFYPIRINSFFFRRSKLAYYWIKGEVPRVWEESNLLVFSNLKLFRKNEAAQNHKIDHQQGESVIREVFAGDRLRRSY